MRHAALLLGFIIAVSARCRDLPCANSCARAVRDDALVGAAFCSSFLSLEPATATITEVSQTQTTVTNLRTVTSTLTVTGMTTATAATTVVIFQKRDDSDAAATISASCSSDAVRLSSACSCLFGSTTPTSAATVTETSSSTIVYQETSTVTEVATASVVETATATPIQTIPANPVLNGGFQEITSANTFAGWTLSSAPAGRGTINVVQGVNYCRADGVCSSTPNNIVGRAFPPTTSNSYLALSNTVVARPLRTYSLTFDYRCLNFDAATSIEVYYRGVRVGATNTCVNSAAFNAARNILFTTDATGVGELQLRFKNPSALPYLYFYFDNVVATVV